MRHAQPGIAAPVPPCGHLLSWGLGAAAPRALRAALARLPVDAGLVVGLGAPLAAALGAEIPGLHPFPDLSRPGAPVPAAQGALWAFVRAGSPGAAFSRLRRLAVALPSGLTLHDDLPLFRFRGGRDLSGYVDGTENPEGPAADAAAFVQGAGPGLDGGSFAASQLWDHDLAAWAAHPVAARDHIVGRSLHGDVELDDAPASAHVRRSAQESFAPPAFLLRRSMPFGGLRAAGLHFLAFGADLGRFTRIMRRMAGHDDGVTDALFTVSRPRGGGFYWCPPRDGSRLDLRALGG
jgi:putative iron-dependent peroxidase